MQPRWQSFIEAWANIGVGFGLALLTQLIVFPMYGMEIDLTGNLQIGMIFTGISLGRSYFLRRAFNKWHR